MGRGRSHTLPRARQRLGAGHGNGSMFDARRRLHVHLVGSEMMDGCGSDSHRVQCAVCVFGVPC